MTLDLGHHNFVVAAPSSEKLRQMQHQWLVENAAEVRVRRRLRRRYPYLLWHLSDVPVFDPDEEPLSRWGLEFGLGWLNLFERLAAQLTTMTPPSRRRRYVVTQAKSKFAEMRVHLAGANTRMRLAVQAATALSTHVCEDCGAPSARRERAGWVYTLCDRHWKVRRDPAEQARDDRRAAFSDSTRRNGI